MDDPPLAEACHIVAGAAAGAVAIRSFFDSESRTATHVVADRESGRAAIIDSVRGYDPASGRTTTRLADEVIAYAESQSLSVEWLLETHAHADHLSAAPRLKERLGGRIAIGRHIRATQQSFGALFNEGPAFARDGSQFDHLFDDGERFQLGATSAIALHVPGHTPADLAYVIGGHVFVGDTLFMPDFGTARADFPGGDARALYRSIRRILSLPEQTRVHLCHDYRPAGRSADQWETTVGEQRRHNIHIHDGIGEEEFVAMRKARDQTLALPRLILPSIQVNMRAGYLPPAEDNGTSYLKIPLNRL